MSERCNKSPQPTFTEQVTRDDITGQGLLALTVKTMDEALNSAIHQKHFTILSLRISGAVLQRASMLPQSDQDRQNVIGFCSNIYRDALNSLFGTDTVRPITEQTKNPVGFNTDGSNGNH